MAEKVDRLIRVNELLKRELADDITRGLISAPGMLVSVTEVKTSVDLRNATVYVSIFGKGDEEAKRTFDALQENAGYIRHELAQVMRMRTVPALTFRMDKSMVYGAKMDELFKKITYSTPEENEENND